MEIGAKQFGAGCPTGPAMPPGRWLSLGGTGASAYAPDLQSVLQIYRERNRSRGFIAGSIHESVPNVGELPIGTRGLCNVDDQRHAKPADRSLPANEAGQDHGFVGRCHAGSREQGILGTAAGSTRVVGRVELASADRTEEIIAGIARSGHFARFTTARLRGDSANAFGTGRNRKIANKPRAD